MRHTRDPTTLPTGTVTFMFTDVEKSTDLLHDFGDARFIEAIEEHSREIRAAISDFGGVDVSSEGDSHFGAFTDPLAAVEAALRIQRGLIANDDGIRVRIGLHTGNGVLGGDNYLGLDVHKASRISDSAHGGQIVGSDVVVRLVDRRLPEDVSWLKLGRFQLAGFTEAAMLSQLIATELTKEFPPLRTPMVASQLPTALTDFVGRKAELEGGIRILSNHRMITLTGPGGTGKTRLALELARRTERDFADGAYFVALASLQDSDLIPMTILEALRIKTAGGVEPIEHVYRHLSDRNVLLVLDNFEQLLDGVAYVTDLLAVSPGLKIIATSRSPLRIDGERELPVPPLGTPEIGAEISAASASDGVRLFINRAEAVRPGFALDANNVETVSAITRSLDGLPLAIELAASRLRSLTPDVVLDRLGNQMLAAPRSDLPERQQTITNAIDWSYDLLDQSSKILFEQVSVFSGSFGLAQAEWVCQGGPELLDRLVDLVEQSLLRPASEGGEPRFRMLTVIREFAFAALVARGFDGETLDRHSAAYLALAKQAHSEILTSRQGELLVRLALDHDNLRGAFDHALTTGDSDTALALAGSLWRFWQIRGHVIEGRQRVEAALALDHETEPRLRAHALTGLGGLMYWLGDWEGIFGPYKEALDVFRASGSDEEIAEALYNLSFAYGYRGDLDAAMALLRESLELSERIGRRLGVGRAHWGLGNMAVYNGDWPLAVESNELAVKEFSELDAPFDLGWAWFMLGHTHIRSGDAEAARKPVMNALEIFSEVGDVSALALILEVVGVLMLPTSRVDSAPYFIGAAHRIKEDTGVAIGDVELNRYEEIDELLDNLVDSGRAMYEEGHGAAVEEVVRRAHEALTESG